MYELKQAYQLVQGGTCLPYLTPTTTGRGRRQETKCNHVMRDVPLIHGEYLQIKQDLRWAQPCLNCVNFRVSFE